MAAPLPLGPAHTPCEIEPSARRTVLECLRTRRPGRDPRVTLCFLIGTELVSTPLVIYVFGYQAGWQKLYVCALVPCIALQLVFTGLNLRLRANEILKNKLFLLVTALLGLSAGYLIIVASIAKIDATPFQSRFLYFVAMSVIGLLKCFMFMWAGLEATILEASVARLCWLALVRAARLTDAATDLGVASTLYYLIVADKCWHCPSMLAMFIIACVSSLCTFTVGMLFIFWPGAHSRERYPWLLVPSFISQLSVLAVMGVLGLGDSRLPPGSANLDQNAFLALSACFSVASFAANLLGVRRLTQLVRNARRILPISSSSPRKPLAAPPVVTNVCDSQHVHEAVQLDVEVPVTARHEPLQAETST